MDVTVGLMPDRVPSQSLPHTASQKLAEPVCSGLVRVKAEPFVTAVAAGSGSQGCVTEEDGQPAGSGSMQASEAILPTPASQRSATPSAMAVKSLPKLTFVLLSGVRVDVSVMA